MVYRAAHLAPSYSVRRGSRGRAAPALRPPVPGL